VSEKHRAGTAQYRRDLLEQACTDAQLDYWTRELKAIDPYLEMKRALPDSTLLRPNFYFVLRHNPGTAPSIMYVEDENGGFMEPTSRIFDQLRRDDMWNAEANHDRQRMRREAELAAQRRKEREDSDRLQEFAERLQALTRTSISMNRSATWSQNAAGRRGRKTDG
jgi:hypothetical protein